MSGALENWLLGLCTCALVCALVRALLPEGAAGRVGALVCALVLLYALLSPLAGGGEQELREILAATERDRQIRTDELREASEREMKAVIERELSAYSTDRAAALGLPCQVRVSCQAREGVLLPAQAEVTGNWNQTLSADLSLALGIPEEAISWREAEG